MQSCRTETWQAIEYSKQAKLDYSDECGNELTMGEDYVFLLQLLLVSREMSAMTKTAWERQICRPRLVVASSSNGMLVEINILTGALFLSESKSESKVFFKLARMACFCELITDTSDLTGLEPVYCQFVGVRFDLHIQACEENSRAILAKLVAAQLALIFLQRCCQFDWTF